MTASKPTVIGTHDLSIDYNVRPTVKALILNDKNEVLIINDGLLPGGGVDDNEDNTTAIRREIAEEVGMTVFNIESSETVIQYRDYISKKYIIQGYKARFQNDLGTTNPQDEGESKFTYAWHSIDDAIELLKNSIDRFEAMGATPDDTYQGKLFNLKTTKILLDSLDKN
jgi:8-oxo-dGTP pyrophosphatase MutT (NUDIX family)